MKIKNILHAAALRLCLVAIAMGMASLAMSGADHYASSSTSNDDSNLNLEDLVSVENLSISVNDKFYNNNSTPSETNGITKYTYYDTNHWYKYGDHRLVTQDVIDKRNCFKWKDSHFIVFKVEKGWYSLKMEFGSSIKDRGMRVYSGESKDSPNGNIDVSEEVKEDNSRITKEFTINVTQPSECLWITGTGGDMFLYSIELTKEVTGEPKFLTAITSPYFWYYNGGPDFGLGNCGYPWGNNEHYRYQPNGNMQASCAKDNDNDEKKANTKYIYINGDQIGGDNGGQSTDTYYGSYIFKTNDAIGIKLDNSRDYRIKVYLYNRDGSAATPNNNNVLYKGSNVTTATRVDNNVSQQSIMINNGTTDTQTRLVTYEINRADAGVYWIKNALSEDLYIGGFEVLPKNYPTIGDTFTGTSWNVAGHKSTVNSTMSSTMPVDYAVDKSTNDNVAVYGPAMALNSTPIDGKTVMLNNGNKFGINLPEGAILSFTYIADPDVSIKITNEAGTTTLKESTATGGQLTVYYPGKDTPTTSAQKIWITGSSEKYVYFSGFTVEQPTSTGPSIDNVTPISENYVWYPVSGKNEFAGGALNIYTDEKDGVAHTFLKSGFWNDGKNGAQLIKSGSFTLYNKSHLGYRTSNNEIGFKIASGKKGVINIYYNKEVISETNSNLRTIELTESGIKCSLERSEHDNVMYAQYYFDTTNGGKTYWMSRGGGEVWFGGFEVLFDVESDGLYRGVDDTYTVTSINTEEITNALSDDKYTAVVGSPVNGPAMIIRQPAADINGVVLFKRGDVRDAIKFNVTETTGRSKYVNVTGYLDGTSTIRIYKGAPSSTNTKYVEVTGSGKIDKTVSLESLGDIDGPYYITSDDATGAYLASVTRKDGNFTTLQPTDVNYIYKVNGVPAAGVQNSGDCQGRIKFVDGNSSAWTDGDNKMNVIGTEVTPVVIENGTDYFAVKVDQGPGGVKTGKVKVYFNGGNSGNHKMVELPLSDPMYSGWNSSYDPGTQTITYTNGGGRGWWFGNEGAGARDLSSYNKINIEFGKITGSPNLQVVVQCTNGAYAAFPYDSANNRILGDLTDTSKWIASKDGATFDITKISQIYIQDTYEDNTTRTVEITSARLMNKPIVIAKGTDETDNTQGFTELFGGKIYNLDGGYVYEYPFDLDKAGNPAGGQLTWITGAGAGTINIAAIEVIYDSQHAKVVDWYVNKDTKMIVGSDDPNFKITYLGQELTYPSGYDEYVTFYMSSGRQANVSFIMPEAVREVHDWELAMKDGGDTEKTYGKHTITLSNSVKYPDDKKLKLEEEGITYNRKGATGKTTNGVYETNSIKDNIYSWYGYSYNVPANPSNPSYYDDNFWAATVITATQKQDGSETETEYVDGKLGQWNIYMRFISFKAPIASCINDNVTVTTGQSGYDIYYTLDSSDPENYGKLETDTDKARSATEKYESSVGVSGMNCIFKAAQYIDTPFEFYEDINNGKDSKTSKVLKVVSKDFAITNEISSVVYVRDKDLTDNELFNVQNGGYMLTIPTGTPGWQGDEYTDIEGYKKTYEVEDEEGNKQTLAVRYYDQPYNANPFMYLTLGGKDRPYLNGSAFSMCGTNWVASNDGGLRTYLDSYQFKMDVDKVKNPDWWKNKGKYEDGEQNQNPYTECNAGPGGGDTEDGGMFLQPIAGTMLRFEPEYDGVITVWLRQNGCLDNNSQENGKFARRPVYVMDENGRIMRRSTIRPTADHYMGINGTWSINSSVCEERSQVEHTWLYEVAKQAFADHPVYASRFNDGVFPNRWETLNHDHSGHILYGWWYKGFDLDATRYRINSAAHVSRFEYMEPQLLYRSDKIYDMEINGLGLTKQFAKYGYELPNFQYVRYRIPVKAGKTYYIAGRGTKNGFSAIRFDALAPNTNLDTWKMNDLRYTDNPEVVENPQKESDDYLKISYNWDNNGSRNHKDKTSKSDYDLTGKSTTEVSEAYGSLDKLTIFENGVIESNTIDETGNAKAINGYVYSGGKTVGMDEYGLGNLVGKTVDVELKRTFTAGHWHPIILPFSLSETRVEQYFGYGTVILYLDPYDHTINNRTDEETGKSWTSVVSQALDGTKLSFTLHRYQMLYANTPAFICPTFNWSGSNLNNGEDKQDGTTWADKDNIIEKKKPATDNVKPVKGSNTATSVKDIIFRRVTLDGSNSRNFLSGNTTDHSGYIGYAISPDYEVVGNYDPTSHTGDIYYVDNVGGNAQLVHSNGHNVTMKGTRVWIRPKAGRTNVPPILTVGSRGFSDFEEDSELTGISDVVADDYIIESYDMDDESVYDLMGRKVGYGSLDGLANGIYIYHGRKVYVK